MKPPSLLTWITRSPAPLAWAMPSDEGLPEPGLVVALAHPATTTATVASVTMVRTFISRLL